MDLLDFIETCMSLKAVEETTPFGPDALVYKVVGKMFALTSPDEVPSRVNLKCDPERALELRDEYESIIPGYHMNKQHWNTVILDGTVPDELLGELIEHSYTLVVKGMTKKQRAELEESQHG